MNSDITKDFKTLIDNGLQPTICIAPIYNNKLLWVFKNEYKIWMLPQFKVEIDIDLYEQIEQKLNKKMGKYFVNSITEINFHPFYYDETLANNTNHKNNNIKNKNEKEIPIRGRGYFFHTVATNSINIGISESSFDQYFWANYNECNFICENLPLKDKAQIYIHAIKKLNNEKLLL